MKVHSQKNHPTLLGNDTEIKHQKMKAASKNEQKGMAFSERLLEVSHRFTGGPFHFSPKASIFEFWDSIKQKVSFSYRNTSRKIFHIETQAKTNSILNGKKDKYQAILYRGGNGPNSCNRI